jgi:hypothetical protein
MYLKSAFKETSPSSKEIVAGTDISSKAHSSLIGFALTLCHTRYQGIDTTEKID